VGTGTNMNLDSAQMDSLQELANIGAAHSATTLSQMVNSRIDMSVPEINVVDISRVGEFLGDEMTTMVIFELQGDNPHGGYLVLHFPRESAIRTANILLGSQDSDHPLNEMDQSAILEVGNIMISAFLSASSDLLGFMMLPSPPHMIVDMAHAAITSLIAQMTVEVDDVILFRIKLNAPDQNISGNILIFLEVSMLQKVADRLTELVTP
jgi:chemotaxis protein CheC